MAKIAPKTTFTWRNESEIASLTTAYTGAPIILAVSTTDKGPENMQIISGSSFFKQYVTDKKTMFSKHGQQLLQAASIIDAGGILLFKRIVTDDMNLANAVVYATITKVPDTPGEHPGDPSVPPADGTPKVTIKIQVDTVTDAKTINDVKTYAAALEDISQDDTKVLPLFVITDVGRGDSSKKFRLIPDYSTARELSFMKYTVQILENTTVLENIDFSLDQTTQYTGRNYGLDAVIKENSSQIKSFTYDENINALIEFVATCLGTDYNSLINTDVLFGKSRAGLDNPEIKIDEDSINLNNPLGVNLLSGGNGVLGDKPITNSNSDEYIEAYTSAFTEEGNEDVFDVDKYQIDAFFDSNLPDETRKAVEDLATFRTDFMVFRDLGFVYTYDQIKARAAGVTPSIFSAIYHNSYDIEDPYSKKQIPVTITYSLAKLFVNHFITNKANPFEGIQYGAIITDAIEGTINYLPKRLKSIDQKQALTDINVNYISYYKDTLVIETEWTSDLKHTQLSWLNNVICIQEIVKMLRVHCPKTRYTFIDEDGNGSSEAFDNYKKDVEERLSDYKSNFKQLSFEYQYDETQVQNKQFYATIRFLFRNFMESEHFNLFAINENTISLS